MISLGICGMPNTGKSTFFSAATLVDVEIGNRPFVTIKPNQGTSYVSSKCPHTEIGKPCQPVNSKCVNGTRLSPITLLDVAGLVPDAHLGKGLGNQFLGDLAHASALIHVIDISGATDVEGNFTEPGANNPAESVRFLEREIDFWIKGILDKSWAKLAKTASMDVKGPYEQLALQLSGIMINEKDVERTIKKCNFDPKPMNWGDEELLRFATEIRKQSKPILIAANKIDLPHAKENFEKLKKEFPDYKIVPCCAEVELALRKADRAGIVKYVPGGNKFEILKTELPENQKKALEFMQKNILDVWGNTGIQQAINSTIFDLLDLMIIYAVQDPHKWVSGKGNLLPDTHLLKKGSNAIDLAGAIHTDFIDKFMGATDCRTHQNIGKEHTLKNDDIVAIKLRG